jgi:lipopolysaccharide export system permease protein
MGTARRLVMKTLYLYLTRQVLATLMMTVLVFTFVLVLFNVLGVLAYLLNGQASLGGIAEAFALLFPWVLVFSLPMAMLTAALMVFGRLSADQELTAVRSSGISLVSLISPVLILSLLLCALSAWINLDLAPRCRVAYKHLMEDMGGKMAASLLPEGRDTTIADNVIYVGEKHGDEMQKITIYQTNAAQWDQAWIGAERGRLVITNLVPTLYLYDVSILHRKYGKKADMITLPVLVMSLDKNLDKQGNGKPDLSDMTFHQLQVELRNLERQPTLPIGDLTIDEQLKLKQELSNFTADPTLPVRVQMHREAAFSFACLGFTLVGIPLGIRAHRRETNVGLAMALGLAMVYYMVVILGMALHKHPEFAPQLIVWVPNLIFQAVGAVMLWRANRGI